MCQCNEHKLYQRSTETEQFVTAKISVNALKQGSKTHSVLNVSAVHNCKNTRLRGCLDEQQSSREGAAGMADTQG